MRIGMFLDSEFPPDSRVENEAVSLIKAGHEVFLFSITYKGYDESEVVNGIQVRRYTGGRWLYKFSALAYQVPYFHSSIKPWIRTFIRSNQVEVLHIHDMPLAKAVFEVNKEFGLPTILDLHENRPEIMQFYKHLKRFPGKFLISIDRWRRAQKTLLEQADYAIVVTNEAKEWYSTKDGINPEKITVVPNTIHPEIFLQYPVQESIKDKFRGSFNIVYVGDTSIRRGTDLLLHSVKELKENIPNLKLILVGTTTEQAELDQIVQELNIGKYVSFEGWQDVSLFPSYIAAANVCVSPIARNIHHDTTYANKLFQYMGMGKPVIVSDCPAQANVIRATDAGLIFKAGDLTSFENAVMELCSNPQLSERLGLNGKEAVINKWNWEKTSSDLIRLYKNLKLKSN